MRGPTSRPAWAGAVGRGRPDSADQTAHLAAAPRQAPARLAVAALITGTTTPFDLTPFAVTRFTKGGK